MVQLYTNEHALDIIDFLQKGYDYVGQCWENDYQGPLTSSCFVFIVFFFILDITYTKRQVLDNKLLEKCFVMGLF
jgi:hypothetical protein